MEWRDQGTPVRAGWSWTVFAKSYNGVREEGKFESVTRLPKFYSFRAYLPRQAAGKIRAEGWVLGKAISGVEGEM